MVVRLPSIPPTQVQKKSLPVMKDLTTWLLQPYSHFMAVILLAPATSKEEVAGIAVHKHLVIQLSQDLVGHQLLVHDKFQRMGS